MQSRLQLCIIPVYIHVEPYFHVCQNQTQATEKQIKEEFAQLREFLQKEEVARLAALQQEHEEKKELVKKKSDSITRDILTFSQAVIAIENEIASSDALFLQVSMFSVFFSLNSSLYANGVYNYFCFYFRIIPTQTKGKTFSAVWCVCVCVYTRFSLLIMLLCVIFFSEHRSRRVIQKNCPVFL